MRKNAALHSLTDAVVRDARTAVRSLRAYPTFAVATIATIGLAIAAAVTAFSFIDSIFLRPLPVPAADRLVRIYLPGANGAYQMIGTSGAARLRAETRIFQTVASERLSRVGFVRERGTLDQRYLSFVSSDYFPMLGLTPRLGRFFSHDEDAEPDRNPVAVVSAAVWHDRFASDPHVIGEHITITGHDFTIVGIGPEGFDGTTLGGAPTQVWLPTMMMPSLLGSCTLRPPCQDADVLAQLVPGVSATQAQTDLAPLGRELSQLSIGDDSARRPIVRRASGVVIGEQRKYAPVARLLAAIAGVLLLLACANVSGLLIARGAAREREIAVRLSLGASRRRVASQLLGESVLIGLAGGVVGVVLSIWTVRAIIGVFTSDDEGFQHFFQLGLDARVIGFAVAVSLTAAVLLGVLPAWTTARTATADVLKKAGGGSARGRVRFGLVTLQVALTAALVSGAALLSRSFIHLIHSQRFDPQHVALFRVRPSDAQYDPARAERYVREVWERIRPLPDVESVAFARGAGMLWNTTPVKARVGTAPPDTTTLVETHSISPGFFATLRIPVSEGREFAERDDPSAPRVMIVSRSVADRLWPNTVALEHLAFIHGQSFRVIGVVPDYVVRVGNEPTPLLVFVPFLQNALGPESDARFAVRVRGDPARQLNAIREVVTSIAPDVPVAEVMTMSDQLDAVFPQIHLGELLLVGAGALALLLSAVGLYGMLAFLVTRRTREIGIRVALGATPLRVVGQFLGQGLKATTLGLAIGLWAAASTSHLLTGWLVGVPPRDIVALALAAGVVLAVAIVASTIPARRAAFVDPVTALRAE